MALLLYIYIYIYKQITSVEATHLAGGLTLKWQGTWCSKSNFQIWFDDISFKYEKHDVNDKWFSENSYANWMQWNPPVRLLPSPSHPRTLWSKPPSGHTYFYPEQNYVVRRHQVRIRTQTYLGMCKMKMETKVEFDESITLRKQFLIHIVFLIF
jgi:hypothetical protein